MHPYDRHPQLAHGTQSNPSELAHAETEAETAVPMEAVADAVRGVAETAVVIPMAVHADQVSSEVAVVEEEGL